MDFGSHRGHLQDPDRLVRNISQTRNRELKCQQESSNELLGPFISKNLSSLYSLSSSKKIQVDLMQTYGGGADVDPEVREDGARKGLVSLFPGQLPSSEVCGTPV